MNRPPEHPEGLSHEHVKSMLLELLTARFKRSQTGPRKATAAGLARYLGAWPLQTREGQRRRVRELIKELRNDGHAVLGDSHPTKGGYWLGETKAEFNQYVDDRRRSGLADLVVAGQIARSPQAVEAGGQLDLFAPALERASTGV